MAEQRLKAVLQRPLMPKPLLPAIFLDVTNIVTTHSRSAHVADEGKQLIFL